MARANAKDRVADVPARHDRRVVLAVTRANLVTAACPAPHLVGRTQIGSEDLRL